ncbi:hypothetical protein AC792_00065 [Arthrobacter sp. RIT-PI-e]|uniref:hypothetical protein n=1 Tax=Arthrobacter sp. RIT-PI-e TaxID=1681197 RepID=UPI000675E56F|nr:hypothetical protein [Arthrobacter sp. RIT-PI-e]KNC20512.1 hypothetical protein AC792_00065 [Arthrobacter sp. RIT-PI-e]
MGQTSGTASRLLKEEPELRAWDTAAAQDPGSAAMDLAHAIRFGRAQEALEQLVVGEAGLTADHARALHFANEMAELHHYAPLIAVQDGTPALAPGVIELIRSFPEFGLWAGQPTWRL